MIMNDISFLNILWVWRKETEITYYDRDDLKFYKIYVIFRKKYFLTKLHNSIWLRFKELK